MAPDWLRDIGRRVFVLWPLKATGTSLFMALFFWAYFAVQRHPLESAFVMPEIALDHWIAFTPASYPVYVSLWVYVSLAPALIGNFRALLHYGVWMSVLCVFCLALFWIFPTQTPDFGMDWRLYPGMATIKGLDAAGNACPSLHVASAVYTAFWLDRVFLEIHAPRVLRAINPLHCLAISWSTMASLQHVALDVLAGAAVGLVFAIASLQATRSAAQPLRI